MQLKTIVIKNYRSIENETIKLEDIAGNFTYTLIGINESGKSSFLKAIALKDGLETVVTNDFYDPKTPISILFNYHLTPDDQKMIKDSLIAGGISEDTAGKSIIEALSINVFVEPSDPTNIKKDIELKWKNDGKENQEKDTIDNFIKTNLLNAVLELSHKVIFWKSETRFLITEPINLEEFLNNPEGISIPLMNCFELAECSIQEDIGKIRGNPAEVKNLASKLSDKVTAHIKRVWPGHKVKIEFQIDNMFLTFLIEDEGVKYNAKITSQRSDGFKQFISFLLTISAQNSTGKLSNTILLLDEPETHLHPKGQENLRDELITITSGNANNICIFATHSNYMIDKEHLDRCFRLVKEDNQKTKMFPVDGQSSSYSEVNYVVFDVPTSDY
ncbi:MAG TPA: AAA family ATPase, partial [Patescibacteria group bacterium]|nr:AAA family ATPase [Patescibacteria group bacterium]